MNGNISLHIEDLKLYKLTNKKGNSLTILNLGASIFDLIIKDNNDNFVNVVVRPKTLDVYLSDIYFNKNMCFGASVGRYAGRISKGEFKIEDNVYQLNEKNGVHLHGGFRGFQHKIWDLESISKENNPFIILKTVSKDGEEGYPGNLQVYVRYTLTEDDELIVEYTATCDKSTPVNLTNHTYFNLEGKGSVSNHNLFINADYILIVDNKQLPTGNFISLKSHDKNFKPKSILGNNKIDDTFILNEAIKEAVILYSEKTGIKLKLFTNQPSIVVFVPEDLPLDWEYGTTISKKFPSICLEAQNYPDAPNHSNFPNSILNPGDTYLNRSIFKFENMNS